jgi:hypothetical protein
MKRDKLDKAISRARDLLEEGRELEIQSNGACVGCRWYHDPDADGVFMSGVRLKQPQCLHPLVSPQTYDIEDGKMAYSKIELVMNARGSTGLCGHRGELWERKRFYTYIRFWVAVVLAAFVAFMWLIIHFAPNGR